MYSLRAAPNDVQSTQSLWGAVEVLQEGAKDLVEPSIDSLKQSLERSKGPNDKALGLRMLVL